MISLGPGLAVASNYFLWTDLMVGVKISVETLVYSHHGNKKSHIELLVGFNQFSSDSLACAISNVIHPLLLCTYP